MRAISGSQLARSLGSWPGPEPGVAYIRLAAAIRLLVLDGRVALETRLPGERELATALGVSRTTVTAAYDALRSSGYALSRRGSGTWTTLPTTGPDASAATPWPAFTPEGSEHVDLAHASPEAPGEALRAAFDTALSRLPRLLPTPGYTVLGLPELRAAIAARFAARGLPTTPEQILVTSGAQHAFSLVLSTVAGPGDRVLVDHPTYPNALDAISRLGARPVPVALGDDGWDVEAITAAVGQTAPRLAYLVPDFNNPTGLAADDAERRALAAPLARHRTLTVVDETLVELPLDGDVPRPFAAGLPDELAVTIGSASKAFWGGLRIGWVRARESLIRRLAAARATSDISSAVLEQLAVTELLSHADDILPARRSELRHRRDVLVAAVADQLPGWRVRVPSGGLVLWYDLGAPVSSGLVSAAERLGVRLAAGPRFGVDGAFERRLRLPYTLPVDVLEPAVRTLARAWGATAAGERTLADPRNLFA